MVMTDPVIEEIVGRALRMYPDREARVGMRSGLGDAAAICDLLAKRVEAANPGRGRGSVSQVGQAIAHAVRKAGDEIMAMRERITVEHPIIEGLQAAVAFAQGDETKATVRTVHVRGGITHGPGSPIVAEHSGPSDRRVPRFEGKRINPELDGDGA